MKSELGQLIAIATVDAEIDDLALQKENLPQIITDLTNQLAEAREGLEARKSELQTLKSDQIRKELELTEQRDWVTQRDARLKEIKTNKEYHAAVKESTQAKKNLAQLEEEILKLCSQSEEAETQIAEGEKTVGGQTAVLEKEIEEKKSLMGTLDEQIAQKMSRRLEEEKRISESTLKRYKMIKNRVRPAVALAINGTCHECNTRLPPQLYNELQKYEKLATCPRCNRILYLETTSS